MVGKSSGAMKTKAVTLNALAVGDGVAKAVTDATSTATGAGVQLGRFEAVADTASRGRK